MRQNAEQRWKAAESDLRQIRVFRELVESVCLRGGASEQAASAALDGLDVLIADLNKYAAACCDEAEKAGVDTATIE